MNSLDVFCLSYPFYYQGCSPDILLTFIIHQNPSFGFIFNLSPKSCNSLSQIISVSFSLHILSIAVAPATCMLCLVLIQIWCHSLTKSVSSWLPIILIMLSNDIQLNPVPQFENNFFNFMSWNLNSLSKKEFEQVRLIEAHNSIFNYDLISICETSLEHSSELKVPGLKGYTFLHASHSDNVTHGGVGLFYKDYLPIVSRNDLSFDESIVIELKFGRNKIFFTVLYRSPAANHGSPVFEGLTSNFKNVYSIF